MIRTRSTAIFIHVLLLTLLTSPGFGQKEEELRIKLPPAVIIGQETMTIGDTRVPPMPTQVMLGPKEEPQVDPRGLSDEIRREIEKTSPVLKSPGCTYATGVGASVARVFKGTEALYNRAKFHYHGGDYDRAWEVFDALLRRYPDSPYTAPSLYWAGEILWHQGQPQKALKFYLRVIEGYPSSEFIDYALYSAGWVSLTLDDPAAAHIYFSRLRTEHPDSPVAEAGIFWDGYTLLQMSRWREALVLFDGILGRTPLSRWDAEALYLKGICLFSLQQHEESLVFMGRVIKDHPSHPMMEEAMYVQGWNLLYLGRDEDALMTFESFYGRFPGSRWEDLILWGEIRALLQREMVDRARDVYRSLTNRHAESPWRDDALNEFGLYYFGRKAYRESATVYAELLRVYRESEIRDTAYLLLGESLFRGGEPFRAVQVWEAFLQEFPDHPQRMEIYYWMGEASLELEQYDRGRGYLMKTKDEPSVFARAMLALGWYHFDRGEWSEALGIFQSLLSGHVPDDTAHRARLLVAEIYFNLRQYDDAAKVFRALMDVKGLPPEVRERAAFYLALAHYKKGETAAAIRHFRSLLDEGPLQTLLPETLYWLGLSYFRQGDYRDAVVVCSQLVSVSPQHGLAPKALMKIGDSYYNLDSPLKAVAAYVKVVTDYPSTPEVPDAEWGLILSFYRAGKYDNVKAWTETFLKKHPGHPSGANALLLVGDYHRRNADFPRAIETYRRVTALYPTLLQADEARLREAELLVQKGRAREATDVLQEVSRNEYNPYYPQALFLLGEIYFKEKEYAKAVAYFEELMKMRNEVVAERAWYRGGETYQAMGETARALEAFRAYVNRYPNSEQAADAWVVMGDIYYREGRFSDAVNAYERALASGRRSLRARAQLAIGRAYRGLNDDETSLTALMKVYYLYPDQKGAVAAALLEAGEIYFAQRRTSEAAQVYRKVLDLLPEGKEADKAREMLKKIDVESNTAGAHKE